MKIKITLYKQKFTVMLYKYVIKTLNDPGSTAIIVSMENESDCSPN